MGSSDDREGFAAEVRTVVESAVAAIGRAGTISAANIADAVEGAGRSLTRRVVDGAVDDSQPLLDQRDLADALARRPNAPLLASATGAAMVTRTLSRFRGLRFLARRTPMWLVASAVPALMASVHRGADELKMVASHLASRARADGIEPDPERLRRVAVQVTSGATVDADAQPRHGPLVVAWLRRAVRAALPFTSGVATKDPDGLAANAAAVDTKQLASR